MNLKEHFKNSTVFVTLCLGRVTSVQNEYLDIVFKYFKFQDFCPRLAYKGHASSASSVGRKRDDELLIILHCFSKYLLAYKSHIRRTSSVGQKSTYQYMILFSTSFQRSPTTVHLCLFMLIRGAFKKFCVATLYMCCGNTAAKLSCAYFL